LNLFVDILMVALFVLFMVFVFGGYHKSKFIKREQERLKKEKQEESLK